MVGFVYNFEMTKASSFSILFYLLSRYATDCFFFLAAGTEDIHRTLIVSQRTLIVFVGVVALRGVDNGVP